jgi:2-dehydropantoate 2-reductase
MNKLLIVGGGSVGIYLFSRLKLAGFDVDLVSRKKDTKNILFESKKIKIETKDLLPKKDYEIVFICVKSYDLKDTLKYTSKIKSKIFVTVQSLDLEILNQKSNLTQILIFEGYSLYNNRLLREGNSGWKIVNDKNGVIVSRILNQAKINCKVSRNIEKDLAIKILFVASTNALSAIYKKNLSELYGDKLIRVEMSQLFDESYKILEKRYSCLPKMEYLKLRMYKTIKKMHHPSSMFQDLKKNNKTEVDFINGYLVKLAKKFGLPSENNKLMIKKIKKVL